MSGHLIGCVAAIDDIGKSHKLAMVAFADSADDRTHIGFPGYEGVMKWAACSRARAAELIADLVAAGYLAKHRRACTGRRAEYVVFPNGCCDLHRIPVAEEAPDVDAIAAAAGVTVDQARQMLAALASGSEIPDPLSGSGSEMSDPLDGEPDTDPERVQVRGQEGPRSLTRTGERVQSGSEISDPSTTKNKTPLPPTGQRRTRCRTHREVPVAGCPRCEPSQREIEAAEAEARATRIRQQHQAAIAADRQLRATSTPAPVVTAAISGLRQTLHDTKAGAQ